MNLLRRTKPLLSFISHTTPTPFSKISPHALTPLTPLSRHLLPAKSLAAPSPRLYFTDRRQIQHFPRRGPKPWYRNPRHVIVLLVLGGGVVLTVYFGNCETVPYTKRSHLVLLSPSMERQLGESQFDQLKESLKGKILPAIHPDSVRVRLISKEIIEALQRGLRQHDQGWSDLSYAAPVSDGAGDAMCSMKCRGEDEGGQIEGRWSKEDEVLDDRWVHQSRQAAESRGSQLATQHLEGLNWEVLVVKQSEANAMCLPGGKIVVFTGLLDHFRSDAEIATVIGHEVGHCIARHSAETITKNLWLTVLQIIILQFFYMPDLISTVSALLLKLPFSRRMEMEADYIGLLLLASAGYDPRVAPKVYEKLGQITGDSALQDYLSTHPSSKKRSQLLSQAEVMDEALAIYREVIAGRGVEGFL